jgi:hypothetical protein
MASGIAPAVGNAIYDDGQLTNSLHPKRAFWEGNLDADRDDFPPTFFALLTYADS